MNETARFLLGINQVQRVVRNKIKKDKDIVHGGHALNKQVIGVARISTLDYDVFTRASPRVRAQELDRVLDRKSGGDNYDVKRAEHRGTFKVFHRRTKTTVADYTRRPRRGVPTRRINGVRYVKLSHIKKDREKILKDKKSEFRHHKDRRVLNHIKISNKLKRLIR